MLTECRQCENFYNPNRDGKINPDTGDCISCELSDAQAHILFLESVWIIKIYLKWLSWKNSIQDLFKFPNYFNQL